MQKVFSRIYQRSSKHERHEVSSPFEFHVDQMDNKQMNINVTDNEGYNALFFAIDHEEMAKVLLQTGKLDLENMQGVSDFVKNPDGSIIFNFRGRCVKMDSPTVVTSIQRL